VSSLVFPSGVASWDVLFLGHRLVQWQIWLQPVQWLKLFASFSSPFLFFSCRLFRYRYTLCTQGDCCCCVQTDTWILHIYTDIRQIYKSLYYIYIFIYIRIEINVHRPI